MTNKERILAVLHGKLPDCVPCCPDISNMVPARLVGKPYWDIYAYQDPPLWKAHIDALKHFDIDGGFECYSYGDPLADPKAEPEWEERVIDRADNGQFTTRRFHLPTGTWAETVTVYMRDSPPASKVKPETIGLPETPTEWEPLEGVKSWPVGPELWKMVRREMGDQGVVGMYLMSTGTIYSEDDVYDYYDDPAPFEEKIRSEMERVTRRMREVEAMEDKPDFFYCGASGSLIWQTPDVFRQLTLPLLKHATELAADMGIPTHVHSCGPEAQLVEMAATETRLTIIDPLEIPPMGNCVLAELKQRFGDKIVLKGNLHTTNVMLRGSADEVRQAARQAMADAAHGGGYILSTGDQCGRDTPDENLFAMIEEARSYGRYRADGSIAGASE